MYWFDKLHYCVEVIFLICGIQIFGEINKVAKHVLTAVLFDFQVLLK